jgi:hypothetical protein
MVRLLVAPECFAGLQPQQGLLLWEEEKASPAAKPGKPAVDPSPPPAVVLDASVDMDPADADMVANMPLAKRQKIMQPSASV